jgi:hypothetical protein
MVVTDLGVAELMIDLTTTKAYQSTVDQYTISPIEKLNRLLSSTLIDSVGFFYVIGGKLFYVEFYSSRKKQYSPEQCVKSSQD